jgi:nucleoside-triphosphatase
MPNNILISGRPGSGKTTLVVKLVEKLSMEGFKAGGFVTEEIREGSNRVGFGIRDLGGETAVLAHIDYKGKPRVGKYGVDIEAFEGIALRALETGKDQADLLVVDEIGRMEMISPRFRTAILDFMDFSTPLLATIHSGNDDFTATLLKRDDTAVYRIGSLDRENILEVVDDSLHMVLRDKDGSGEPEGGTRL